MGTLLRIVVVVVMLSLAICSASLGPDITVEDLHWNSST